MSYHNKKAEPLRMRLAGEKLGTPIKKDREGVLVLEISKKETAETFRDKVVKFTFIIPKGFFKTETGSQYIKVMEFLKKQE